MFTLYQWEKYIWDFCLCVSLNKLLSSFFQKSFLSYSTFIAPLVFFVVVLKTRNVHCRQSLLIFIPELTHKCNKHFLGWHFSIFNQGTFYSLIPGHHCGCLSHHFCQHSYSVASILCALWGRSKDHSDFIHCGSSSHPQGWKVTYTFVCLYSHKTTTTHCFRSKEERGREREKLLFVNLC